MCLLQKIKEIINTVLDIEHFKVYRYSEICYLYNETKIIVSVYNIYNNTRFSLELNDYNNQKTINFISLDNNFTWNEITSEILSEELYLDLKLLFLKLEKKCNKNCQEKMLQCLDLSDCDIFNDVV